LLSTSKQREPDVLTQHRELLQAWVRSEPDRPIYSAIRSTFIDKYARLYVLITKTTEGVSPTSCEELNQLEKDCTRLARLIFTTSNVWAARSWQKPPILKFLMRDLERKRGGRPATKQQMAIRAKEMRLIKPKRWTWRKIAATLCDCGKEHTIQCQDNIRREIQHLDKLLKSLGCKF
jgi:hypothetical protein